MFFKSEGPEVWRTQVVSHIRIMAPNFFALAAVRKNSCMESLGVCRSVFVAIDGLLIRGAIVLLR